jgi:predicted neuraminidase
MRLAEVVSLMAAILGLTVHAYANVSANASTYSAELIFPLEPWHNHASCVIECPNGDLLACWFHGSGEKVNDVIIEGARKVRGEAAWRPRFVMADTPGYPDHNPCLFVDPKERLWLFWPTLLANRWETAVMKCKTSTDYQKPDAPPVWSWQDIVHVTPANFEKQVNEAAERALAKYANLLLEQIAAKAYLQKVRADAREPLHHRLGWMTRAHPTLLPSGRLILPLYTDAFSVSIMAMTDDWGRTWQTSDALVGFGNIQPSVVRRNDGSLVAMMRENGPLNRIRVSESRDEGRTWSPVQESQLPNPGSGLEVIGLANGHWALIYNDTTNGRHSLAVSISEDEGKTWRWTRHLERTAPGSGSYAYPSMIQARDGSLHATYSLHLPPEKGGQNRKSIKHARFSEEWVQEGDPAVGPAGGAAAGTEGSYSSSDRLVGTYYFYWYKYPGEHFFDRPGDDGLTDHFVDPEKVDYESVAWHRGELSEIASCGIDFILPVYWGAPGAYETREGYFSVKGLDAINEARKQLLKSGKPCPRIGMFYDTSTLLNGVRMQKPFSGRADLTTPEGKEIFYGTIRDYFKRLDRSHWAMIDGRPIVGIYNSAFAAAFDLSAFDYLYDSFEKEFGIKPYVIADESWKKRGKADAWFMWGAALDGPRIRDVAQIGPGYDDSAVPGRSTPVRDREDGRFYEYSWQQAMRSGKNVVLIETWNEMHEGTDICRSKEYGTKYIDLTRDFSDRFKKNISITTITLQHPDPIPRPPSKEGGEFADAPAVSIDFTSPTAKGLRIVRAEDGRFEAATVAGKQCVRSAADSKPTYLYFAVADPFYFDRMERLEIEVEYYDGGGGAFGLQYDSIDRRLPHLGAYKEAGAVERKGTDQWTKHTFQIEDAAFMNRQNRAADFRFAVIGEPVCISRVMVRKAR